MTRRDGPIWIHTGNSDLSAPNSSELAVHTVEPSNPKRSVDLAEEATVTVSAAELGRRLLDRGHARLIIRDEIVYELVTYGDGAKKRLGLGSWCQGGDLPKAVLTHLAMKAFGVHRLPWHHDQSFARIPIDAAVDSALQLMNDDGRVAAACVELRRLHEHTLRLLRECGVTHVRLRRGLHDSEHRPAHLGSDSGYASRLATMATIAQRLDRSHIEVPFNVLSSWSAGGYAHFSVVIEHDIPVESIGWCWAVLATADRDAPQRDALEAGEWVVLNRSADGRLRLRADCVQKCDVRLQEVEGWSRVRMKAELAECERTYGPVSSIYRDATYCIRALTVAQRLRRAWAVLHEPYA